jgi:hypothetical protein
MLTRRELVTGSLFAGTTIGGPEGGLPLQKDSDDRTHSLLSEIRDELRRSRATCNANDCPEVERVRNEQRTFLKGRNKFPDYIDVGADIWDRLCDWHVKNGVPLQVARTPEGRYSLPFFQTFVVLRPDVANTYVSTAYDR